MMEEQGFLIFVQNQNSTMIKKSVLITGSNSGIGKLTAEIFAQNNWTVFATMRNPEKAGKLAEISNIKITKLDVTDTQSILAAKDNILKTVDSIDLVINNAGYGCYGAFEAATEEQIDRQLAVNVKGVMMMTKTWLPHFRKHKAGMFINVSSVAGLTSYPLASLYITSKWAVEGFTEALYYETKPFNIKVKLVEPGAYKTNFQTSSITWTNDPTIDAYDAMTIPYREMRDKRQDGLPDPKEVAQLIYEVAHDESERLRYLIGEDAEAVMAKRIKEGAEAYRLGVYEGFVGK